MLDIILLDSPDIRNVHFIGIGGISMSGLAEILLSRGFQVTGSDMKASPVLHRLEKLGAAIYIGHSADHIGNPDLVVYTAAVKEGNAELVKAREKGIPVIDRATLLGEIMKGYPNSVAISGTHGKTTTTSMITTILMEAGTDPTVHIGGKLESIGGSTRIGGNRYFVTEACEYYESFLKLTPYIGVILNIELDHVDYFKDIQQIKESFLRFTSLIPEKGHLVACADDSNIRWVLERAGCDVETYGLHSPEARWTPRDILFDSDGFPSFTLCRDGEAISPVHLQVPGIHNISNALAAAATCQLLGCSGDEIARGLQKFGGTDKRFQLMGTLDGIRVIDDYAHHPTEVRATLKAATNTNHNRIWCVFQPHTYTRTKSLLKDFSMSFQDADTVIVSDIYAAREADTGEIHASMLADEINRNGGRAMYLSGFDAIAVYLQEHALPGDLILTMGAGDICKVGETFLKGRKATAAS